MAKDDTKNKEGNKEENIENNEEEKEVDLDRIGSVNKVADMIMGMDDSSPRKSAEANLDQDDVMAGNNEEPMKQPELEDDAEEILPSTPTPPPSNEPVSMLDINEEVPKEDTINMLDGGDIMGGAENAKPVEITKPEPDVEELEADIKEEESILKKKKTVLESVGEIEEKSEEPVSEVEEKTEETAPVQKASEEVTEDNSEDSPVSQVDESLSDSNEEKIEEINKEVTSAEEKAIKNLQEAHAFKTSKQPAQSDSDTMDKSLTSDLGEQKSGELESATPVAELAKPELNTDKKIAEVTKLELKIKKNEPVVDLSSEDKIVEAETPQEENESTPVFASGDQPSVPAGTYEFPENFLWGTSTSAYQVEGGIKNDWSEWEISEKRLAWLDKHGYEKEDFICGQAVDHYNRYKEDIVLAKGLHNNSIRIGLEWARIQPEKETWNVNALNHYREVLKEAKRNGLQTIVTLWHWTNPLWLVGEGGWSNKKVADYYAEYVDVVIRELGGEVDYWITLNEPLMHVFGGYLRAYMPPATMNLFKAEKVFRNLVRAHKKAYKKIHKHFPSAKVSITQIVNYFEPAHSWNPFEQLLAKGMHYYWNHRFLARTKKYLDYIGLDYYFHDRMVWYPPFRKNKNAKVNDKGWEIYPEGILEVLRYLKGFKKPIIVMENGLADASDKYRASFIIDHLYYIHKAIEEGIDVRGYCHWSLLDNFEWAYGWDPQFGLYHVDRKTFKRTERPSADVYRRICEGNRLEIK